MFIGQSLLYKLGFCKYEPEEKVIRTSKNVGNKRLAIYKSRNKNIAEGALHTYELEVVRA